MSTKKLLTAMAALTVVALAAIGVAYGAWTDTLHINGNVTTGTFDVALDYMYYDAEVPGCTAVIAPDGKTLTVSIANAYPGYHCGGGVSIRNLGTVPAKINGLVEVSNTVPAAFRG